MLDAHKTELINGINNTIKEVPDYTPYIGGKSAAAATIEMMRKIVTNILPPKTIIDVFNQVGGKANADKMWTPLKDATITCMNEGCYNLARFWESAWIEAGADNIFSDQELGAIGHETIAQLYNDPSKFPSYKISDPLFSKALS
jgi:hypothetical protein